MQNANAKAAKPKALYYTVLLFGLQFTSLPTNDFTRFKTCEIINGFGHSRFLVIYPNYMHLWYFQKIISDIVEWYLGNCMKKTLCNTRTLGTGIQKDDLTKNTCGLT